MKHSLLYGVALILGSVGGVATMLFHPTGRDLLQQPDHIARVNEVVAVANHSLGLVSLAVLLFGFVGLTRRLGWDDPPAAAAYVAYAFGAVAAMCAAVINGLVAPAMTRGILEADGATRQALEVVFMNNTWLNQAFSKVFGTASSAAVILWSYCILKGGVFSRSVGVIGAVTGLIGLAGLLSGHLRMNVHGFGFLVLAQSVWILSLGVLLCRERSSSPAP